jgi:hypothetical protein
MQMIAVRRHSHDMKGRVIAVGLLGLALAAGSGASGAVASSAYRHDRTGTLAGVVVLIEHRAAGSVKVLDATGRLVAQHEVRWSRAQRMRQYPQARFAHFGIPLRPGRYRVELQLRSGAWDCPYTKWVSVRADRTARVSLSEGCEVTY